jgi:hypothetical protein
MPMCSGTPSPVSAHHTVTFYRNSMFDKGYYVQQGNFADYTGIKRILEMESLYTQLQSF